MKSNLLRLVTVLLVVGGAMVVQASSSTHAPRVLAYSDLTNLQKRLLSGVVSQDLAPQPQTVNPQALRNFSPIGQLQCGGPQPLGNTKVNQNCLNVTDGDLQGRGQANNETSIAYDPNNNTHAVVGANDYRRGDGNCYGSYNATQGGVWADTTIPMGFVRGTTFGAAREYFHSGGDTSVAWDTKGNAYFSCQMFNRGTPATTVPDTSSGLYVFRSTGNNGASWNFPARPVVQQLNAGPSVVPLLDKQYITVDNHVGSPFQDRIYVAWTLFAPDGTAIIYEAYSSDYGQTFSAPVVVSVTNGGSTLCPVNVTTADKCDANQFADPFTGPDGNLYIVYSNFNNSVTGNENFNQILLSKSTDGGNTFSPPVQVGQYYDLPDCATYQAGQNFGRSCVPEKGSSTNSVFRAANYPVGAVNPLNPNQVVVTYGSYINKYSNELNGCVPNGFSSIGNNTFTGVKTPGACNNKIVVSVSNDAGSTFTGTTTNVRQMPVANQAPGQTTTDQFWQWAAFTTGGRFAVSYFDRQYGADETTGSSDIGLSGSSNLTTFGTVRVTTSSMPLPTQFPDRQGNSVFYGDYTGMATVPHNNTADVVWMDTRSPDVIVCPGTAVAGVPPQICTFTAANGIKANDQDIFEQKMNIP